MHKHKRRSFLLGLSSFTAAHLLHQSYVPAIHAQELEEYSNKQNKFNIKQNLRNIAASKGIIYGGFHQRSHTDFPKDIKFTRNFLQQYSLIVGGFFGVTVGPFGANNYDFVQTNPFIDFAEQNQLLFRAHPLLWNEFNSDWLVNKFKDSSTTNTEIDQIFTNHVSTLVSQYAGRVSSWDVVNEVINVDDGRPDKLKDTTISGVRGEKFPTWLNYLGPDYIERAFRLAHQADPQATLVLNENGLAYSSTLNNSFWEQRRVAVLELLDSLVAKDTPIHALGIQSHLLGHRNDEFDGKKFRKFLSDVASMGLKIIISELDVIDQELPQDIQTRDRIVAEAYYEYLSVVLDEPAVTTVVNWGLNDRHTWLADFAPRNDGADVRPLLLDRQYTRKPAWKAVARAFKEAPRR